MMQLNKSDLEACALRSILKYQCKTVDQILDWFKTDAQCCGYEFERSSMVAAAKNAIAEEASWGSNGSPVADTRPRKDAWAPGNYTNECRECKTIFLGDKRARLCADCAYSGVSDE